MLKHKFPGKNVLDTFNEVAQWCFNINRNDTYLYAKVNIVLCLMYLLSCEFGLSRLIYFE